MEKHYKVFIIDDDRFLLDMYSVKFRERGLEVEVGVGGEDALEKLRGGLTVDIILLDLVMPEIDGFEVLETIKKEKLGGSPIIIILSNQGQDTEIARARQLGADDYIVKASAIPSEVLNKIMDIAQKRNGEAT